MNLDYRGNNPYRKKNHGYKQMNKGKGRNVARTVRAQQALFQRASTSYTRSLLCPEIVRHAKIPCTLPLPTVSHHFKRTIPVVCNAGGQLAVLINPWYLVDIATTTTNILINNHATLNLTTGVGGGLWTGVSQGSVIAVGDVSAYRLVSASIQIYCEAPITECSGYIAGGIVTAANMPGSFPVAAAQSPGGAFNQAASIDQLMYYQRANCAGQQGVRAIYVPFDPTFEMFIGLNYGRAQISNAVDQFYWNFYVNGASANQPMIVEIYYNFELEPQPLSLLQTLADISVPFESDAVAVKTIQTHPNLVSQSNSNLSMVAQDIDQALTSPNSGKSLGWLDESFDFLSQHSSEIGSAFKLAASAFF